MSVCADGRDVIETKSLFFCDVNALTHTRIKKLKLKLYARYDASCP